MVTQGSHNYTKTIVDFVGQTDYSHLPNDVIAQTKRIILDTIGCGIGGYTLDRGKMVTDLARELGGKPEATVLVTGDKVSCTNAAFANGDLCNALDADETFMNSGHFAATVLAAALAVAEREGASGRDLITAFELGFEVNARLLLSMGVFQVKGEPPDETLEASEAFGYGWICVGAAVAASKILNLDTEGIAHALGLAGANGTSPSTRKMTEANWWPMMKYGHYGFASLIGVVSALLAQKGYTGKRDILDGDVGLWRFSGSLGPLWDNLVGGLGEKWWIQEDSIKPYPSCRYTHQALDMFYKIKEEQGIQPDEIENVTVRVGPAAFFVPQLGSPSLELDPGDPTSQINSQFNMAHLISVAALGYEPGPDWHNADTLRDSGVRELMKKVKVELDFGALGEVLRSVKEEPIARWKKCPTSIEVVARGEAFKAASDYGKGDPWIADTLMSNDEVKKKFRNLTRNTLPSNKIDNAIELILGLEQLDNVGKLTESITK
ncbi:MAG: MmgE/PrpD family protein [Dehalococcoidia bacterium]|nr:MAG: MmgE/PrpD family protein [Dehalococcoidia bacterium]